MGIFTVGCDRRNVARQRRLHYVERRQRKGFVDFLNGAERIMVKLFITHLMKLAGWDQRLLGKKHVVRIAVDWTKHASNANVKEQLAELVCGG